MRALGFALAAGLSTAAWGADGIDDLIRAEMTKSHIPGLVVEIVRDGRVVRRSGYGVANLEGPVPATPDTVFEIGSMTKQFTAAAILLLQDRGQLSVEDPVGKYLPDLPEAWRKLTLRQLMNHVTGLKDYAASNPLSDVGYKSLDALIRPIAKLPFDFEPGTGWQYSNTGFLLAGAVVERVSGKPLAQFWSEQFFQPLGMKSTRTTDPVPVVVGRARGYAVIPAAPPKAPAPKKSDSQPPAPAPAPKAKDPFAARLDGMTISNINPTNPSIAAGAGNLMSTVDDLMKWSDSLSPQHLLSLKALEQLTTPLRFADGTTGGYGFGEFLHVYHGQAIVEHGGNTLGQSAELFRVPGKKLTIAILTNAAGLSEVPLARAIADRLIPDLDITKVKPGKDPHPEMTKKLQDWFAAAGAGKVDKTIFSDSFSVQFKTLRGMQLTSGLTASGKMMHSLSYVEDEAPLGGAPGERIVRYKVDTDPVTAYLEVHWTGDGRISSIENVSQVPKALAPKAPAKR